MLAGGFMIKALAISLVLFTAASCKKKEETKPAAAPTAEAKPTEAPKPAETTPPPAAAPAAATAPGTEGVASIAIPQAKAVDPAVLTGGQPTDEQLAMAKEKGVKTVVNLRAASEEKDGYANESKKLGELGVKYVHIPIDGKTGEGLNEENAKKLAELLNGEKPMIVHCASGQRVGALYALKAFYVDKKPAEEALTIGRANGLSKPELEKIVTDQMAAKKKG